VNALRLVPLDCVSVRLQEHLWEPLRGRDRGTEKEYKKEIFYSLFLILKALGNFSKCSFPLSLVPARG
jgi:hypothetical protein